MFGCCAFQTLFEIFFFRVFRMILQDCDAKMRKKPHILGVLKRGDTRLKKTYVIESFSQSFLYVNVV